MNNNIIPKEYKIDQKIHHKDYLINGEIKEWNGKQTNVISTILCDSDDKDHFLIGTTPN